MQGDEENYYTLDLEEDYEANWTRGYRPDPFGEGFIPVGLCKHLSTRKELVERQHEHLLSKYEMVPDSQPPLADPNLVMKQFSRSAAGREFSNAVDLRPWSVLKKGLSHLLLDICLRPDDWMQICDFVFDRLKSIRQDMVIQRIEGKRYIEVLEGSVRFLIYSMYKLTCCMKDYTDRRTFEIILSPQGTPLSGLSNYELFVVREMKLTMHCLRDCLTSLIVQYQDHAPDSSNRPIFEAISLIVNLPFLPGYQFYRTEFQSKKSLRNSDPVFKTVFKMYRKHLVGDHLGALRLLQQLSEYPLIVLAYAPTIASLQIHMMSVLKKSHATKGPCVTHPSKIVPLICPEWLDPNPDERLISTIFIAMQMGLYDDEKNLCNFNIDPKKILPNNFDSNKIKDIESDNETRNFALQMLAGRNWSFYRECIAVYGTEAILDPSSHHSVVDQNHK